ncbi:DUF5405 family protein [Xenorhabdus japonica]|uniref:DUF5405 domain-containing protein n=1 Tax=Xenorhabdus japonica TaxID=53341 RepID=A0A1I5CTF2_9GAMM|nr:DUF5405 family protein [Xenorhabdus japonica]SFN90207.1 hypothetical protein SAMN05421579_13023 [Xenorhabdus japonica]
MKLDLGKYVITSDSRKFILNTKTILKSGKNAGQETLRTIGYYRHLNQLMRDVMRMEIDSADIRTLQQLSDKIDLITRNTAEMLNNMSTEIHRCHAQIRELESQHP